MNSTNRLISSTIVVFLCMFLSSFNNASIAGGLFQYQGEAGGTQISPKQKAAIVKGKTTTVQILQELGGPDQKIDMGKGRTQYSFNHGTTKWSLFSPIKYGFGGNPTDAIKYTEFWVIFKNDVVEDFGKCRPTNDRNFKETEIFRRCCVT